MSNRRMTPKGQMSGNGSGPAIMMMPPNIREAFMPDPPLKHLPPPKRKRPKTYSLIQGGVQGSKSKTGLTGVADYMKQFERTSAPKRQEGLTPLKIKEIKQQKKKDKWLEEHRPLIEEYRKEQRESGGEFMNMNCYNTLFVGRLAYEVTERKLLREFETFGPVKDIKLVTVKGGEKDGKSRGYAFIEYEQEEDMKRAYRAADGMKIEGKEIVVDVERGHTVPTWLPRRFGGGLGGTRYVNGHTLYCFLLVVFACDFVKCIFENVGGYHCMFESHIMLVVVVTTVCLNHT
jgi:RNA-binding proteins (RRM domain)